MSNSKQFGETVEGYNIPVLNEREIRASAGILFLIIFVAVMLAIFESDFTLMKFFIVMFLIELNVRLFINPKYAPFMILGRMIVKKQKPEYVGAAQKRFAWYIGLFLGTAMFFLIIVFNTFSEISGLTCFICEIFLFSEAAFGVCIGCNIYKRIYKEKAQYCPGEVCEINEMDEIQKTSGKQKAVFMAFLGFVVVMVYYLSESFGVVPRNLWDLLA